MDTGMKAKLYLVRYDRRKNDTYHPSLHAAIKAGNDYLKKFPKSLSMMDIYRLVLVDGEYKYRFYGYMDRSGPMDSKGVRPISFFKYWNEKTQSSERYYVNVYLVNKNGTLKPRPKISV